MHENKPKTFQLFDTELNRLHLRISEMGHTTYSQLEKVINAVKNNDMLMAREIKKYDVWFIRQEREINRIILQLISRRGATGPELQCVLSFSRMLHEFDQIYTEITSISDQIDGNSENTPVNIQYSVVSMGMMILESLDCSLKILDAEKPFSSLIEREKVLQRAETSLRALITNIIGDCRNMGTGVRAILIIKSLERIGLNCLNIGQQLRFMNQTEIAHFA